MAHATDARSSGDPGAPLSVVDAPTDTDPQETSEWVQSIDDVLDHDGPARARHLLERVVYHARRRGAWIDFSGPTPYVNTIPPEDEEAPDGDPELERRLSALVR